MSVKIPVILPNKTIEYTLELYKKEGWYFQRFGEKYNGEDYIFSPQGKCFPLDNLKDNICCICTEDDFESINEDHDNFFHDEELVMMQNDAFNLYSFITREKSLFFQKYLLKK